MHPLGGADVGGRPPGWLTGPGSLLRQEQPHAVLRWEPLPGAQRSRRLPLPQGEHQGRPNG